MRAIDESLSWSLENGIQHEAAGAIGNREGWTGTVQHAALGILMALNPRRKLRTNIAHICFDRLELQLLQMSIVWTQLLQLILQLRLFSVHLALQFEDLFLHLQPVFLHNEPFIFQFLQLVMQLLAEHGVAFLQLNDLPMYLQSLRFQALFFHLPFLQLFLQLPQLLLCRKQFPLLFLVQLLGI